jgi:hypothetical protein
VTESVFWGEFQVRSLTGRFAAILAAVGVAALASPLAVAEENTVTVEGLVWFDRDADGVVDVGEPPLANGRGVSVYNASTKELIERFGTRHRAAGVRDRRSAADDDHVPDHDRTHDDRSGDDHDHHRCGRGAGGRWQQRAGGHGRGAVPHAGDRGPAARRRRVDLPGGTPPSSRLSHSGDRHR